jgi:hypothetical protein
VLQTGSEPAQRARDDGCFENFVSSAHHGITQHSIHSVRSAILRISYFSLENGNGKPNIEW